MPEQVGEVYVALRSDGSRVQSDIESQLTKALGPVVAKGAKILAGLFVGKQVVGVARSGIAELAEAEKQSALTAGQIRATGEAAGITQQHVQDLAAANLKLAGTDDEVTVAAERVLLQFNRITAAGGIFDETLKSAQDLATVTGQDLPSTARALGLALQDPLRATRLLRAENIALTATQQEQIKQFVASGNILGAQRVILDQVSASVGGAGAAFGGTLAGDLQRAQEELENTKASLLEGAVPAIELFANASTAASEAIQGLPVGLRTIASGAIALAGFAPTLLTLRGTLLQSAAAKAALAAADATGTGSTAANTAAIEANTAALVGRLPVLEANVAAEAALAGASTGAATASAGAGVALEAGGASAASMLGPVALLVGTVVALGFGFREVMNNGATDNFGSYLKGQVPDVAAFTAMLPEIQKGLDLTGGSLADVAAGTARQSIPAARNLNEALRAQGLSTDEVTAAIDKQEAANKAAAAGAQGLTAAELDQVTAEKALLDAQTARFDAITGSVSAEQAYERSLRDVESAQRGVQSATRSLEDAQAKLNDALAGATAEELAKAELGLESARLGSTAAAKTQADEEAKLEQLRHGMSGTVDELASAEDRLASARESQRRANQSLEELERTARINARRGIDQTHEQRIAIADAARSAQDAAKNTATEEAKLAVLRAPGTAQQIADQEAKVATAKIATQTATFAVTDAESALQIVQAQGTESDQAVIDSRQRVADASQGVTDANQRVTDSYGAVATALAANKTAQDILAGASGSAVERAYRLRDALAAVANKYAPGSPERKNIETEIALLDRLLGNVAKVGAVGGAIGAGAGGSTLGIPNAFFGIKAASGFAGTVNRPTGILAGEGGRAEDVLIVPHSSGGIAMGASVTISVPVSVNFHGVVPTEGEAFRTGQAAGAGVADVLERRAVALARKIA